jgi:ribosomal protein S6--L-glutamate ligase
MIKLVENFREFLDLAKINQGPDGWTIYGSNPKSLSHAEKVAFPDLGIKSIRSKIDTGADGTSIHANGIKEKDGILSFWVTSPKKVLEFKKFNKVEVTNSSGTKQMRYQINTMVEFGDHSFKIKISLADRGSMKYPCILGKNFLKTGKFTVDVNQ